MLASKEEKIWLYTNSLNYYLLVLFVYMNLVGKEFNQVYNNVKKLEGVTQLSQAKMLAKKSQNIGNFNMSLSKVHGKYVRTWFYELFPFYLF